MKDKRRLSTKLWYHLFYCWWTPISDFPREIKYFIQRGRRGWSDRDTWSFDFYLNDILINGLKHLKKYSHGEEPSQEEFDIMIKGFEANLKIIELDVEYNSEEFKQCEEDFKKGMKIFVKNFNNLWD